jgi:hypothetical protein
MFLGDISTRTIAQSQKLALALSLKRPIGDIVHLLSLTPRPSDASGTTNIEDVPVRVLEILGPKATLEVLGLMVEVYRYFKALSV